MLVPPPKRMVRPRSVAYLNASASRSRPPRSSWPGSRVEPRVVRGGDENRLTGYAALPFDQNPYVTDFGSPVPAAGAVRPSAGTYYVVFDSPNAAGAGTYRFRFWVDDVNAYDLGRFGPLLENHPIFPERANISLAHVVSREHIVIRTWERGAGLTKACGTAACATAVAAARLRRTERKVTVTVPGGDLGIEWRASDDHVLMTGPVEFEFEGRFDPALFAAAGAA